MQNGLVPHSHVAVNNQEGYLGSEVAPEELRLPAPNWAPQPRVPVPEREITITSGCENQQGLWLSEMAGFWSPRKFLLKGLGMDLLKLTGLTSSADTVA